MNPGVCWKAVPCKSPGWFPLVGWLVGTCSRWIAIGVWTIGILGTGVVCSMTDGALACMSVAFSGFLKGTPVTPVNVVAVRLSTCLSELFMLETAFAWDNKLFIRAFWNSWAVELVWLWHNVELIAVVWTLKLTSALAASDSFIFSASCFSIALASELLSVTSSSSPDSITSEGSPFMAGPSLSRMTLRFSVVIFWNNSTHSGTVKELSWNAISNFSFKLSKALILSLSMAKVFVAKVFLRAGGSFTCFLIDVFLIDCLGGFFSTFLEIFSTWSLSWFAWEDLVFARLAWVLDIGLNLSESCTKLLFPFFFSVSLFAGDFLYFLPPFWFAKTLFLATFFELAFFDRLLVFSLSISDGTGVLCPERNTRPSQISPSSISELHWFSVSITLEFVMTTCVFLVGVDLNKWHQHIF